MVNIKEGNYGRHNQGRGLKVKTAKKKNKIKK